MHWVVHKTPNKLGASERAEGLQLVPEVEIWTAQFSVVRRYPTTSRYLQYNDRYMQIAAHSTPMTDGSIVSCGP